MYGHGPENPQVCCTGCAQVFCRIPSLLVTNNFCSVPCYRAWVERAAIAHFWARVTKTETCWLWVGPCHKGKWPYGVVKIRLQGKIILSAHKVAGVLTYGSIPDGQDVLHRCDIPPCVCPNHLFLGTDRDNQQDAIQKGRFHFLPKQQGEQNGQHKLTWEQARAIRALRKERSLSLRTLGAMFDVHWNTVNAIVRNKNWHEEVA